MPALLLLALAACDRSADRPPNDRRTIVANAGASDSCATLPDTLAEVVTATPDANDLPDTRIVLAAACPRATVLFIGGARLQRTYRVPVTAGATLIARARGEVAPVALAFDYPATPRPDSSNVGRLVVDSIRVDADREVAVRVMLVPHVKNEPRESRVLLTVLVRP